MSGEFELFPYPILPFPEGVYVAGKVKRIGALLQIGWRLEADSETVLLDTPTDEPLRRRELWDKTCFEFFLRSPEHPGYWEFNLSPAGHWNVFHFDEYRAGMKDEATFSALPFTVFRCEGACEVSTSIDTTGLGIADDTWMLAISMVIAETNGRRTYWALSHPGNQPDFHHPRAFQVRLTP